MSSAGKIPQNFVKSIPNDKDLRIALELVYFCVSRINTTQPFNKTPSIDNKHLMSIGVHPIPSIDVHLLVSVDTNLNRRNSWSFRHRNPPPEASPP